jgi:hypothetical protein
MIERVSRGFWRSDDGRFEVYEVTALVTRPPGVTRGVSSWDYPGADEALVCVTARRFVVYDFDRGRRLEFESGAQALAYCVNPPQAA